MPTQEDGVAPPRRWWAVAALSLSVSMTVLVGAVVNIALPTLSADLGIEAGSSVWVVTVYQLAVTAALLPASAWGDRVGHLRVYRVGLVSFLLTSAACAMVQSFPGLVAVRGAQGFGSACMMAVNTALLRMVYPSRRLGRGLAFNGMVVAASAAIGPSLGGSLLAFGSWHGVFAIFIPLAMVAWWAGRHSLVDVPRADDPVPFDARGAILQAFAVCLCIVGLGRLAHIQGGWPLGGIAMLGAGSIAGAWFVRRELGRDHPLLPLDLLRRPLFALSYGASFCSFVAQMVALISLPFWFSRLGFSPEQSGLLLTPWPLAVIVVSPIAGALADRGAGVLVGGIGLVVAASALASLAVLPPESFSMPAVAYRVVACGSGFGLFSGPNLRTLVAAAPAARIAVVGAMTAVARQTGQATGAALAGMLFAAFADGAGPRCLGVAATIAFLGALLSLMRGRIAADRS